MADRLKFLLLGILALAIYMADTGAVYAQTTPMGSVLCFILAIIYGNLGRAVAVMGVITLGFGAVLGKISWGPAITVAVGISIVFGSVGLAMDITGQPGVCYSLYKIP
ncbi:MAG: TrbC/VirB2 family protein [Pseudomonadota bacterium]|nr:TrbC/VirB2 family protein [Pseudomonadota bacterium]MDE3037065.1 TrbC/VirB2 family protein [Pseudomonadota bacterium]